MVATLVGGPSAENIAIDFECVVATYLPLTVSVRRLVTQATWFRIDNDTFTSAGTSVTGKLQKETNQAKLSSLFPGAQIEGQENLPSDCGHQTFEKRCTSSFQTSKLLTQQGDTKAKKVHPRSTSKPCLNIKISKETGQPTQLKKGSPLTFLLLQFSLTKTRDTHSRN